MEQHEKVFFEVFPDFHCPEDISGMFNHVIVKDVILSKANKELKIYTDSKILIPKENIYKMEDSLSSYLFQNRVRVRIVEHYELSGQYNVKSLTDMYKESLLKEIYHESNILYGLVKNAIWYVNENVIHLTLDDTFLARKRSIYIKNYLETVYKERFGFDINVGFDYTEAQKEAIRLANEHTLELEVKQILEKGEAIAKENEALNENKASDNKKSDDKGANGNTKGSNSNKSDKPNDNKENSWKKKSSYDQLGMLK
jgi:DNA polymerase-3 subunit alpha (Gram-positive type)